MSLLTTVFDAQTRNVEHAHQIPSLVQFVLEPIGILQMIAPAKMDFMMRLFQAIAIRTIVCHAPIQNV